MQLSGMRLSGLYCISTVIFYLYYYYAVYYVCVCVCVLILCSIDCIVLYVRFILAAIGVINDSNNNNPMLMQSVPLSYDDGITTATRYMTSDCNYSVFCVYFFEKPDFVLLTRIATFDQRSHVKTSVKQT